MIIRRDDDSLLLITQPDHAALAARIMRRWVNDGLPASPRRDAIHLAIAEHDNGWQEVDAAPIVDPETGRLVDFISASIDVRTGVWPRGVDRLAHSPYAAALVAQHALHIYRRYRADPAWASFFAEMEVVRDQHLRAAPPATLDQLLADYRFVRIGDLLSLTFCNAWTDRTEAYEYTIQCDGSRVVVSPDPFGGAVVPIAVPARRMPNAPIAAGHDARALFERAPAVTLTGAASAGVAGA